MSRLRQVLAVALCLGLLSPPPGWAPLVRATTPDALANPVVRAAMAESADPQACKSKLPVGDVFKFLDAHAVFKAPNESLRPYVGKNEGGESYVTCFGEVLYLYLKSQPNPDEEVEILQDALKALAKSGPFSDKKAQAFVTQMQRYDSHFGGLPEVTDAGVEDTFRLGTLREAMMTGASVIDAPKAEFAQVDLPDGQGWEFWDKEGLAFKLNKNKVTIYSRELQKQQRELNKSRPPQAHFVPETGRYNYEMFEVSYWRLKLQKDQIDLSTRLDRMVLMAELLGEQKKDQNFFDRENPNKVNEAFEKVLISKAKAKTYSHNGRTYSIWDIAYAKTKVRETYLTKAQGGIDYFQAEMAKFKDVQTVTDAQVKAMATGEQFVMRYLSLAFLEAQKYAVRSQLERLDPDSPDSAMVTEALKDMPLNPADKAKYKGEGAKLRARLERLLAILGRVEDVLFKTDYTSNLDLAQAALNSSQKELGEIGTNYEVYTTAPGMLLALKQQSTSWLPKFNGSFDPRKWEMGSPFRGAASLAPTAYAQKVKDIGSSRPAYEQIAAMVADGRYWEARKAIVAVNPDAVYDKPTMSLTGEAAKVNDAARLAASLRATRETVAKVAEVNRWVDAVGNLVSWSVGIGFGAPILRKGLAFIEVKANSMGLKLIASLAEQTRLRLASLEPSQEALDGGRMKGVLASYVRASAYRTWSFGVRQVVFTGLSGTISGIATALGDATDRLPFRLDLGVVKLGDGPSNFKNPVDAFAQGATGGVLWANQSFHPMLGYIGLPSSYFEGGRFAGVAQTIGERGAVGTISQGVKTAYHWGAGKLGFTVAEAAETATADLASQAAGQAASRSLGAKAFEMVVKKPAQFMWGMADNVAKYALFSQGVGWAAKNTDFFLLSRFHNNKDVIRPGQSEDEKEQLKDTPLETVTALERRIKRSEKAAAAISESPVWLLMPVFPAKYEEAAKSYQRSRQGEEEYQKADKDAVLANAAADQTALPMLGRSKPPIMQQIFNYTAGRASDTEATFLVTKDIKRRAISRELKKYVAGSSDADLGKANPQEFLKISRSDPAQRKMIGRLFNSDDVRNEARKQCVESLIKNPTLAEQILGAKPGSNVEGFGRVTPGVQREVASMMLDEIPVGIKISPKVQGLATGFIQRYLESNNLGKPGGPAETLLKKAAANVHETPAQAEALNSVIQELRDGVAKWNQDVELQATKKSYMDVSRELRQTVEAKFKAGNLTQAQYDALTSMFGLVEAQEARFYSFNNVETTHQLLSEELSALRVQYEGRGGVQTLLEGFNAKLSAWRDSVPQAGRKTTVADAAPFKGMLGDFNKGIKDALSARAISPEEASLLREVVNKDMAGAPWILHDSKNTALKGWRPAQFVTYFEALTKVVEMGKGGEPIRGFMRLTTGGGKTLLAFEGLLPIAEADARMHNMKVGFFTVQSNLDAQAQLEWRSLRKVGSKLEFDTYEGLKSKIAEAKNKGQKYVDTIWILGDEMDGAALQPALTLGETTGKITRKNSVYTRVEQLNTRMEQLVQQDAVKLSEQVKTQARQAQGVIDGLDVRSPDALAARTATEKLIRAAEDLSRANSPQARLKAEQAIRLHLSELGSAMSSQPLGSFPESFSRIFAKNTEIQTAVDALPAGATPEQVGKVRQLLIEQQNLLSSKDLASSEAAKALRRETGQLLSRLAKPGEGADLGALLKGSLEAQQSLLHSTARVPDAQRGSVQAAANNITRLLQEGAPLDAAGRKAMGQEVADNLKRQKNLLPLVQGEPQARLENLRLEARGLRENAQSRVEAIKRKLVGIDEQLAKGKADKGDLLAQKGALESEIRLAQREAALAQRFEGGQFGRAQNLIDKVFDVQEQAPGAKGQAKVESAQRELSEVRKVLTPEQNAALDVYRENVSKLYDVGRRMAAVDDRVLEATRAGKPVEPLQKELATLQAEADGVKTVLSKARQDARPQLTAADLNVAHARFSENSQDILDLLGKGDAESQAAALRLLNGRKTLLDAFAGSENPLYEVYRKMKADAYSVARSPIWDRDESKVASQAAEKSKSLITGSAQELGQGAKAVEGLAKPGETPAAAKLRQQAQDILRSQEQKWTELSGREPGDRTATLKNMGEALDAATLHMSQRERFLKTLRAQEPGLEAPFVERLESVFKGAELRDAALKNGVSLQMRSMEMTTDKAVALYTKRIDGEGLLPLAFHATTRYAGHLLEYPKTWLGLQKEVAPFEMPVDQVGLTRRYSAQMMKEILADPMMPAGQRDKLLADVLSSFLFPKSPLPGGQSSWVRQEFLNLVQGFHDDYATVRMDNITGKTNVIHNGQWFETMDNPTRRFWELEYGTDITLPYTHKSLSTIKDVTSNSKTRMFALSATAGEKYVAHLRESKIAVAGQGAKKPANVSVDTRSGAGAEITGAGEAVSRVTAESRKTVVVRPAEVLAPEAGAPAEVRAYLEGQGIAKKDAQVLKLDQLPPGPVQDYFTMLRSRQPNSTGLLVISLPDTRALKMMRHYLIKANLAKESEIAQVFSDTEYLRANRPQANVTEQMNLDGMKTGKVKILLLDTRVGGRGLDLEYKGDRGDPRPEGFKGYTNYEMLVMDPNKMSAVHLLQAEGRIDVGRVLLGANRNFRLLMDVKALQKDAVFEDMFRNNELFVGLRNDPRVREFARAESQRLNRAVDVDWSLIDVYVKQAEVKRFELLKSDPELLEFASQKNRQVDMGLVREYVIFRDQAAQKSKDPVLTEWVNQNVLPERYNQVIEQHLERKQEANETNLLRQSSVLQDKPVTDPKMRWFDQLQRGR